MFMCQINKNVYYIVTFLNFVTGVISHAVALALLWLTVDNHFVPSLAVWYVGEGLTVFVSHCSSVNSIINRLMLCHAFSFCHRYGFGSEGKPEYKIGPDKDIIYEVTLKDFQRVSPALSFFINSQPGYESGFGLFLKQKKQCLLNFCDINCVSTRLKNPGKWT